MKKQNINIVASTIITAALSLSSGVVSAASTERCADVVKGGKNTCAVKSLGISCQGNARDDNMTGAWIKVPAGTCTKIVSFCRDNVEAPASVDQKKLAKACEKIADQNDESVKGGRLVDQHGESI